MHKNKIKSIAVPNKTRKKAYPHPQPVAPLLLPPKRNFLLPGPGIFFFPLQRKKLLTLLTVTRNCDRTATARRCFCTPEENLKPAPASSFLFTYLSRERRERLAKEMGGGGGTAIFPRDQLSRGPVQDLFTKEQQQNGRAGGRGGGTRGK